MELTKNIWYVRWFFFNCKILDRYCLSSYREKQYKNGTNLCHFIRTLLYGSLALFLLTFLYTYIIYVIVLPFILFPYMEVIITIAMTIFVIISTTSVFLILIEWKESRSSTVKNNPAAFMTIIKLYYISWKEKFCPTINFFSDEGN
jgi:hypothetical protein